MQLVAKLGLWLHRLPTDPGWGRGMLRIRAYHRSTSWPCPMVIGVLAIPAVCWLIVDLHPEVKVVSDVSICTETPATNAIVMKFGHTPASAEAILANPISNGWAGEDITRHRGGCGDVTAGPPVIEIRSRGCVAWSRRVVRLETQDRATQNTTRVSSIRVAPIWGTIVAINLINTQGIVMRQFAPRHTHACFCMRGCREHADNSETTGQFQDSLHVAPLGSGKFPPSSEQKQRCSDNS